MTAIFAHRGASGEAPENTMEAFELACEKGADGIELDVQLTRDGEVVVIHDETIDRVSDGTGAVRDYTLEELRRFSFHNYMEAYRGARIPTLREVLKLVKPKGLEVNVELKTSMIEYPGIEKKVLDIVRQESMQEKVIYSSFNHRTIRRIREMEPTARTAFLLADVLLDAPAYARSAGVQGLHPSAAQLKMSGILEQFQKSGLEIRVWTVDAPEEQKYFREKGLDAIITNYP